MARMVEKDKDPMEKLQKTSDLPAQPLQLECSTWNILHQKPEIDGSRRTS
jgi:hypothetical protein